MNLVDNKPKLYRKHCIPEDKLISNCTDCRRGLFPFHAYEWTNRGLVHIDCTNVTAEVYR